MKMSQHWPAWIAVGLLTGVGIGLTGCQDQDGKSHQLTASASIDTNDQDQPSAKPPETGPIHGGLSLVNGQVILKAKGLPNASISEQGEFRIDDKPLNISPDQQVLFRRFHAQTETIVHQSLDVAKAGVGTGAGISTGVLRNVLNGKTDDASMQATVHEHLTGLSHSVDILCDQLAAQKGIQDRLAGQVAAFRPYASITDAQIQECHHGASEMLDKNAGDHDQDAD